METKEIKVTVSLDMLQRARDYVERCRNQVIVDEEIEAWIDEYDKIVAKTNEGIADVSVSANLSPKSKRIAAGALYEL